MGTSCYAHIISLDVRERKRKKNIVMRYKIWKGWNPLKWRWRCGADLVRSVEGGGLLKDTGRFLLHMEKKNSVLWSQSLDGEGGGTVFRFWIMGAKLGKREDWKYLGSDKCEWAIRTAIPEKDWKEKELPGPCGPEFEHRERVREKKGMPKRRRIEGVNKMLE